MLKYTGSYRELMTRFIIIKCYMCQAQLKQKMSFGAAENKHWILGVGDTKLSCFKAAVLA